MRRLQQLMIDIQKWSDGAFGNAQRTIPILHHLKKEVPEAIDAVERYYDNRTASRCDNAIEEFADCFMLLLDSASHFGLTADELLRATERKLEINKKRTWGKPDENGVVEHVRD